MRDETPLMVERTRTILVSIGFTKFKNIKLTFLDIECTLTSSKHVIIPLFPSSSRYKRWVFKTESHDIAFGVTYVIDVTTSSLPPSPTKTSPTRKLQRSKSKDAKGEGNPHVVITPIARMNCHQLPEDGYLECEQAGTCKFVKLLTL